MHSRWYSTAVVLLWLASMSWLVKEKILPPMLRGEPPSNTKILDAKKHAPPVGWRMSLNGRSIGWAMTDCELQPSGLAEIHGRAHFDELPLEEMMHGVLQPLSKLIGQQSKRLRMDARSLMIVDPFGQMIRFDSALLFEPSQEIVTVKGTLDRGLLELTLRVGGVSFPSKIPMHSETLLSDVFSPQSQLPGLRVGQTWTVPICNPLWPSKTPLEILQATVERSERISYGGVLEEAWLVVYRSVSDSAVGDQSEPKGKIWVRRDSQGTVLRQEAMLFDSTVVFDRMTDEQAEQQLKSAGDKWWSMDIESKKKYDRTRQRHPKFRK
jgi:hypothetical protein